MAEECGSELPWVCMPFLVRSYPGNLSGSMVTNSLVLTYTRLVAYSKWINKGLPLRLKERRQVARELHQRMYSAFAE
jgi:hypothetical protein